MLVLSTARLCSLNLCLRRRLISAIYFRLQRLHLAMSITFLVLQVICEVMERVSPVAQKV